MIEELKKSTAQNIGFGFRLGLNIPDYKFINLLSKEEKRELFFSREWEVYNDELSLRIIPDSVNITLCYHYKEGDYSYPFIIIEDEGQYSGGQGRNDRFAGCIMFYPRETPVVPALNNLHKILKDENPDYNGWLFLHLCVDRRSVYYRSISFDLYDELIYAGSLFHGIRTEDFISGSFLDKSISFCSCIKVYPQLGSDLNFDPDTDFPSIFFIDNAYLIVNATQNFNQSFNDIYTYIEPCVKYGGVYKIDAKRRLKEKFLFLKSISFI